MAPGRESGLTPTGHVRRDGLPRRFRSSTLRAGGAGRLALEQNSQRGLQRPRANPRTCARGRRRGSRSYPQFRCTNLTPSCAQTLAVNRPDECRPRWVHESRRSQPPAETPEGQILQALFERLRAAASARAALLLHDIVSRAGMGRSGLSPRVDLDVDRCESVCPQQVQDPVQIVRAGHVAAQYCRRR